MSRSPMLAVDCRNLTYRYGQFTAVDDFTLQVRSGETMGLLGPTAPERRRWCACSPPWPGTAWRATHLGLRRSSQHRRHSLQHRLCAAGTFD
ncbi:ABC transporter, ATP-binding component domain protein [Mycobacterium xenopi 4042]|uniref:ABC transporter, ATP-binding component domain protein n=1 Tax=Mycobacterium xenopi 4042 TaxID=1299334 RepID=X8CJY8_MYCXE|nr:ABC transporter, ATP-binding component domain protein [Mycobacterium xenopi 4042]